MVSDFEWSSLIGLYKILVEDSLASHIYKTSFSEPICLLIKSKLWDVIFLWFRFCYACPDFVLDLVAFFYYIARILLLTERPQWWLIGLWDFRMWSLAAWSRFSSFCQTQNSCRFLDNTSHYFPWQLNFSKRGRIQCVEVGKYVQSNWW